MKIGRKAKVRADTTNPCMAFFIANDGDDFPVGYTPITRNEEVLKCANIIADLVSSMTIMLMQNGKNGDERIRNGLSKKIDIKPCYYMDRKNFIFKIVKEMVLSGNSVVYPEISINGYLENLEPLEAQKCSYRKNGKSYLIIYGGKELLPDEVLHFVLVPDLQEPFKGIGYKETIISAVSTLVQANATKKGFLKSKWKPSMVISVQTEIEDLINKEKRKNIIDSYVDTTEAGEPWLIPAGEMDVKTIQPLTLADLAIQDSITLDIKSIAAAMGIPPFMVGIGDFNKEQYNNFISTKIMAIAQIVQQQFSNKLLYSPYEYFKLNKKSLMQYDLKELTQFTKEMVSAGIMNRNEGRNEFDQSPVDKEGMNEYIVLENYIPVEKVGKQKKLKDGESDGAE